MHEDYFEYDKKTKALKAIDINEFSVEDLREYIDQLQKEIKRVNFEIEKKSKLQTNAEKYFK